MSRVLLAHAAAATAAFSAGAAVVATRFVIGETDPVALAFYRYAIGVICLVPVLPFIWPKSDLSISDIAKIAGLGVIFFGLFPWSFNASLQHIPAARCAVGLATIPIQTLVISALFGREKITINKLAGVATAFIGTAIVFGPSAGGVSEPGYVTGDILILLGALSGAIYSVFSRASISQHGPLFVTALAMIVGVVALFPIASLQSGFLTFPNFSFEGWIAVLFLGTFAGAIQFSLFTWALRWLPPTVTVLYLTLNPLAATVLGFVLLSESVETNVLNGLLLVLLGIVFGSGAIGDLRRGLRPQRASSDQ
ncbi:MAG: DMT family transporter [Pseudomonadota bacterium]